VRQVVAASFCAAAGGFRPGPDLGLDGLGGPLLSAASRASHGAGCCCAVVLEELQRRRREVEAPRPVSLG
jgi:hypothetical protein